MDRIAVQDAPHPGRRGRRAAGAGSPGPKAMGPRPAPQSNQRGIETIETIVAPSTAAITIASTQAGVDVGAFAGLSVGPQMGRDEGLRAGLKVGLGDGTGPVATGDAGRGVPLPVLGPMGMRRLEDASPAPWLGRSLRSRSWPGGRG